MSNFSETERAMFMLTRSFEKYKYTEYLTLQAYSNGLPFCQILNTIPYFESMIEDLELNAQKVSQKLNNLKKIVNRMQNYVLNQTQKFLKVNDLQLIEIAKNFSRQNILRMFEVVVAVLMQTPQKQIYIQQIMDLDERSQQALVIVVQKAMEIRICQQATSHQYKNFDVIHKIQSLQNQNEILREQINQLCLQHEIILAQNNQFREKILQCEQEIDKAKKLNIKFYMSQQNNDKPQNNLIEMLKNKMLDLTREHQMQRQKYHQEIDQLKIKIVQLKDLEEEYFQKQKRFEQKLKKQIQNLTLQKKKTGQKQIKIKKLQYELDISKNKIRQLSQDIEVNDLNLRIQLQKKQVRFKQLEKQVKSKVIEISESSSKKNILENKAEQQIEMNQDQIQYLKAQVQKLRNTNCEYEKQNLKLKKKSQKIQLIENQKKKLERIILDVSKTRDTQIQMLVSSLYDLRNQNFRMYEIITELKTKIMN